MASPSPQRRSLKDKLAERNKDPHPLVEVAAFDSGVNTSTFRVEHTGELTLDTAASLATTADVIPDLGDFDLASGAAHHLLALPDGRTGEEVEALAISVWNEAGWTGPGALHLTEGVSLEGPWTPTGEVADTLGLNREVTSVWVLRSQAMRGAAPNPEIMARDELARAFPEGMPLGAELKTLMFLARVARRLGGQVRLAGSGYVQTPDPESSINLRIYTDRPTDVEFLRGVLARDFPEVKDVSGAAPHDPRAPHAFLLPGGRDSQVLVGMRPADDVPRALRWEAWLRDAAYMYEVNWATGLPPALPDGQLTRVGRRERNLVAADIARAAATIVSTLRHAAVIDEDDFLVRPDELLPEEEPPHL